MRLLALAGLLALLGAQPADAAPAFTPRPCQDATLEGKARCGFVEVAENRHALGGRRIRLNVVVLPALKPDPAAAPMYDLEGGPGLAVTRNVGFYLEDGAVYRDREIVLIDQRGTGASNPLTCPELAALGPDEPLYPPALVRRCRVALEARADLTRYGTADAVADLEDVRRALGHRRIVLNALSYGTTLALRYLATHPDRVRAMVLWSAVPAWAMPPRDHAPNAEASIRQLFADCAADAACARAYPVLEADLDAALARREREGSPSREVFAEKLRTLMYGVAGARRLPAIIHAAAAGDLAPYRAAAGGSGAAGIADGVYLSITCAESMAALDYEAAARAARATRFGDYRLRRQRDACAEWPRARVAPKVFARFRSDVPVLLVSGGRDPVTPVAWAGDLRGDLRRSAQLLIPDGGHIVDGLDHLECLDGIVTAFMASASPGNLDTACLAQVKAPPFLIAP